MSLTIATGSHMCSVYYLCMTLALVWSPTWCTKFLFIHI